jgi:CheY-like chemotaxis protein/HPt (histidine-containing phosphotransfer) domain-containing protein
LVQNLLEAAGHTIDTASNGKEAIEAVQAKTYDLVLMDIQMPGMDGLTATRIIRSLDHPTSKVFIAAMTANVLPQQVRSFLEAGINDHIGKPVRRDDLLRKLSEWLSPGADARLPDTEPSEETSSFKQEHFQEFRDTIGADRIGQWLLRLDEQLKDTFSGGGALRSDHQQLARDAHATISQAALLGFSELAELCTILEQTCIARGDVSVPLERVCEAAQNARERIAQMSEEAPMAQPV